jgi:hypothetical protein
VNRELNLIHDRWKTADADNDDALSIHEFLGFRHPETNGASLNKLVKELLTSMGKK